MPGRVELVEIVRVGERAASCAAIAAGLVATPDLGRVEASPVRYEVEFIMLPCMNALMREPRRSLKSWREMSRRRDSEGGVVKEGQGADWMKVFERGFER